MRNIIYIFAILAGLGLSSCSDEWMGDVIPKDNIGDDDAFKNIKDGQNALNGIFSMMQHHEYYGAYYLYYGDVKAMDIRTTTIGRRTESEYLFQSTTEASPYEMWSRPYTCLVNINNAIINVEEMPTESVKEEQEKLEIQANFYALRALTHFDLLKVFSRIPTAQRGDEFDTYGVPLADQVFDVKYEAERASVEEVYTLIFEDLAKAKELMPAESNTEGWFNATGVKALASRANLYHGNYTEAYNLSKEIIDAGSYSLIPYGAYGESWGVKDNSEAILTIINSDSDNASNEGIGYLYSESGYDAMIPADSFKSLLSSDSNDDRNSMITTSGYFAKFPNDLTNNIHLFRLSEMYLIAAECAIHDDAINKSEATKYLNELLAVRTDGNTSLTDDQVDLDRVLLERRKELVGEGHVYFDYIRNKKDIVRTGDDHFTSAITGKTIEWEDYRIIQPIPRKELNANSNMIQNPEYAD